MPTRPRNAARTPKTSSSPQHSSSASPLALPPSELQYELAEHPPRSSASTTPAPLSAVATPLSPSPAAQLPTPLPEPQERLRKKKKKSKKVVEDATARGWDGQPGVPQWYHHELGDSEQGQRELGQRAPHMGFPAEEEVAGRGDGDGEEDVLGRLIDFSTPAPASPLANNANANLEPEPFLGEGGMMGDDREASLSGFLNDHLDAPVDQHDFHPGLPPPFGFEEATDTEPFGRTVEEGARGAGEARVYGDDYAYEGQGEGQNYRSPAFIEARLPPVEDEVVPVPPALTAKEKKKARKAREKEEREKEEREREEIVVERYVLFSFVVSLLCAFVCVYLRFSTSPCIAALLLRVHRFSASLQREERSRLLCVGSFRSRFTFVGSSSASLLFHVRFCTRWFLLYSVSWLRVPVFLSRVSSRARCALAGSFYSAVEFTSPRHALRSSASLRPRPFPALTLLISGALHARRRRFAFDPGDLRVRVRATDVDRGGVWCLASTRYAGAPSVMGRCVLGLRFVMACLYSL